MTPEQNLRACTATVYIEHIRARLLRREREPCLAIRASSQIAAALQRVNRLIPFGMPYVSSGGGSLRSQRTCLNSAARAFEGLAFASQFAVKTSKPISRLALPYPLVRPQADVEKIRRVHERISSRALTRNLLSSCRGSASRVRA